MSDSANAATTSPAKLRKKLQDQYNQWLSRAKDHGEPDEVFNEYWENQQGSTFRASRQSGGGQDEIDFLRDLLITTSLTPFHSALAEGQLGFLLGTQQQEMEAFEYLDDSISQHRGLLTKGEERCRVPLALTLRNKANFLEGMSAYEEAEASIMEAERTLTDFSEHRGSLVYVKATRARIALLAKKDPAEVRAMFDEAEKLHQELYPEIPYLVNRPGADYNEFLLGLRDTGAVIERTTATLPLENGLYNRGMNRVLYGIAVVISLESEEGHEAIETGLRLLEEASRPDALDKVKMLMAHFLIPKSGL